MKRLVAVTSLLLAGAGAALAGGSKNISNDRGPKPDHPTVRIPAASEAPTGRAQRASPALYLQSDTVLGTLASERLGGAIPALRALAGPGARLVCDPHAGHVVRALGMAAPAFSPGDPTASALSFLRSHHAAFGLPTPPEEGWITDEVPGVGGGRHLALEQRAFDGVPLYGAVVTVHVDALGAVYMVQSEAVPEPALFRPKVAVPASLAEERGGALRAKKQGKPVTSRLVYLRPADDLVFRLAWQVDAGADRSFVDAETGGVIERVDRRSYANGAADLWDPNILDTGVGGGTANQVAEQSTGVPLTDLDGSGLLKGSVCDVVDPQHGRAGGIIGATIDFQGYDPAPGATLSGPGGQEEFVEQISVYHYVVTTANLVKTLSPGAVDFGALQRFFPLGVIVDIDTPNNAFFDPSDRTLQLGDGAPGEIDHLQKDIDVAAHEFGHFVEAILAPDQTPRLNSPRRAMGEGFGDFLAATVNGAAALRGGAAGALCIGDSTIPLGGGVFDCLREYSLTSIKVSPGDVRGQEHSDGEVIAGALFSLAARLTGGTFASFDGDGLRDAYRILLAGLPHLPRANASFSDLVDALVEGDRRRTGSNPGANEADIIAAFARHGITGTKTAPSASAQSAEPRELLLGISAVETFTAGELKRYFVRVPTGSGTALKVQTLTPSLNQLTELYVAPNNYDSTTDIVKSIDAASGSRNEQLVDVTSAQARGFDAAGNPVTSATSRIGDDVFWLIDVIGVQAGSVTVTASDLNGAASQPTDLGAFTGANTLSSSGSIPSTDTSEVDLYFFQGTANQVVRVLVTGATSAPILRPSVWIFDPSLHVLSADVDGDDADITGGQGADATANNQAFIEGQPLPTSGTYVIAVNSFSADSASPTSFGSYSISVGAGTLPGDEIAFNSTTLTFSAVTGSVRGGEDLVFHLPAIDTSIVNRLRFVLSPVNATTTSDLDLLVATKTGSNVAAEFASDGLTSNEQVDVNAFTTPALASSKFYFVIVRGYEVKGPAGTQESFQLQVFANEPFTSSGGGGGGGCAIAATAAATHGASLWLPTLGALLAIGIVRRRSVRRSTPVR